MTDQQYLKKALRYVLLNPDEFCEGFDDWLIDNIDIQRKFDVEALRIVATGRTHYSAYTIREYIRHHTALRQKNSDLKLSNNWTPSIARVFAFMNPQHKDLFQFNELFVRKRS